MMKNGFRVTFTSNEMGNYQYKIVKPGETPEFDLSGSVELMTRDDNSLDLMIPETEEREVWILAKDIAGNQMSTPVRIQLTSYEEIRIMIKTVPTDATVTVKNQDGEELKAGKNGRYTFLKGNTYRIEITRKGYEDSHRIGDSRYKSYQLQFQSEITDEFRCGFETSVCFQL